MKAISIRQPWAHAILHLGKRVENRDWSGCAYRGRVLLHASAQRRLHEFTDAIDAIASVVQPQTEEAERRLLEPLAVPGLYCGEPVWRPAPTLPFGGIVGRARIVDVLTGDVQPHGSLPRSTYEAQRSPWYAGGFALVLADVEPLPFISWKGSLGFFDVPDEPLSLAGRPC